MPKNLSVLHSRYPWDTPCRVWSDLDNSLTQWNRPIFKFRYLRNSQISVWNTNFFPRQAIPKILFVLHSWYHWDTPCRVWSDLDNSLTQWNRPIFKIRYLRNSQISVWNTNFFPRQAIPKILFVLHSHTLGILHTKFGSLWTTLWPNQKDLFLKLVIQNFTEIIRNFRMKS